MKIASWNVNSVKARLEGVTNWLKQAAPDVLCMQEIKSTDETFPAEVFAGLGYNLAVHGQKTYNGVAILSKYPLEDVRQGLPGMEDDPQARYIEAVIDGPAGAVRVASIYAPNGNPLGSEKFPYKLDWMTKLRAHAEALLRFEEATFLCGDYNVIPTPADCYDPAAWSEDALYQPESRAALRRLIHLGYADSFRTRHRETGAYSFWDYQAGAWPRDHGIRIDFQLTSPQATDRLSDCGIDRDVRATERPSDHVPVWCILE